ncbi:MAG: carboxymuconolactone decarboxylase family protein [Candidatus Firestonebacteria bacterium]
MDDKAKELIAIGASVTANCQPCLNYHVSKAKENGANEQEIEEAIEVGKMVRKGAMGKMDKVISTVIKSVEAFNDDAEKGCGCN